MFAKVLPPLALAGPLDYRVPDGMHVTRGMLVRVPLGRKTIPGVVWEVNDHSAVPEGKVKPISEILPSPPFEESFLAFIDWVAAYSFSASGAVLAMALSAPQALGALKPESGIRATGHAPRKMTVPRARLLALLKEGPLLKAEAAERAEVSGAVINALLKEGVLAASEIVPQELSYPHYDPALAEKPLLSGEQKAAASVLRKEAAAGQYACTLLDGVTGSGKTEVYLEAVEEALMGGRQVLVLLPEIVLTAQLIQRFEKRLGFAPTPWHSALTPAARRDHWRAIHDGRAKLIVGARSALFLPYNDLALIVVDEEHETAYKQEDGVIYHARDMAVARGFTQQLPVVLVSATPSLETLMNVEAGKFTRLHLPERHGAAELPELEIVDMRQAGLDSQHFLSPTLKEAMAKTLALGEQVLLYLNRRGFAPLTLCRKCGHRFKCPSCSAWLVMHKRPEALLCHHCGYRAEIPKICPSCQAADTLVACGPGVERLTEEVKELFPEARILEMTSDTLGTAKDAEKTVQTILERQADIIVGTQMVAKGHHFPFLTLVGVVDADLGLEGGDLRAAEKSYQLLHQVAGRAGREGLKGRALLQTYQPEHPLMLALKRHDRSAFVSREVEQRKAAGMPPFGRLAALILSGRDEAVVRKVAQGYASAAPSAEGVRILGPAPAPLSLLRGQHRYRLLVKTGRQINVQKYLAAWMKAYAAPSAVRVKVDIDPYSFL
jgi:primosomal protein N' (replication factor Y)